MQEYNRKMRTRMGTRGTNRFRGCSAGKNGLAGYADQARETVGINVSGMRFAAAGARRIWRGTMI